MTIQVDRFGGRHSTDCETAVQSFERAVEAVAAHRPVGDALQSALTADPDFVAGHALSGFAHVILARAETLAGAKPLAGAARQSLNRRQSDCAGEIALVDALDLAVDGRLRDAADRLEQHLVAAPTDFLALKISHALRFMSGQAAEMLDVTRNLLPSWSPSDAAYGYVLGCHAFGLEETGHYRAAEKIGRDAYAHQPSDAWGLHAVSHVMEMERRCEEGVTWLERARGNWRKCNNFSFHMAWHLALFHLEKRDIEAVLLVYDREIRPESTDDFRDMANATSMLWRLEQEGVDVGRRWEELHAIAAKRATDVSYVFGSLHYMFALVAQGDHDAAEALIAAMRDKARQGQDDQSRLARDIGIPIAECVMATRWSDRYPLRADIVACAGSLPDIGGSHAQRDVFLRTLLSGAAARADSKSVLALTRIRHNLRSADRFIHAIETRLSNGPIMSDIPSQNVMIATH